MLIPQSAGNSVCFTFGYTLHFRHAGNGGHSAYFGGPNLEIEW